MAACAPVSAKRVAPWSNVPPENVVVLWQVTHWLAGKPAAAWSGVADWYCAVWQDEHAGSAAVKLPPAWHEAHSCATCEPVSGNAVREWSNVAVVHTWAVWQPRQSIGKPCAAWSGLRVAR
ncbi:MAG: hypothetical protein IPJ04_02895 [Candidatus Eisenbacteria bacterium]|nr:hypothetical protein [Candidatus Eisenbacteria bacterium]